LSSFSFNLQFDTLFKDKIKVDSTDYVQFKDSTVKKKMFSKLGSYIKQQIAPKLPFNRYFNKSKEIPTSKLQAKPKLPAPIGYIENQFHYCENDTFNFGVKWYSTSRLNYAIDTKLPVIIDAVAFYNINGLDKSRSRISLSFDKKAWDQKQKQLKNLNNLDEYKKKSNFKFRYDNLNIKKLEYSYTKEKLQNEFSNKLYKQYSGKLNEIEANNSMINDSITSLDSMHINSMKKYVSEYEKLTEKLNETENYFNDYKEYTKLSKNIINIPNKDSLQSDSLLKSKMPKANKLKNFIDSIENFQIGNALLDFSELSISGIPVTGFYFKKKGINIISIGMGKMVTPSLFKFNEIKHNQSFAGAVAYQRRVNEYLTLGSTIFKGKLDTGNSTNTFLPPTGSQRFTGICISSDIQLLSNTNFVSEIGRSFSSLHNQGDKDAFNGQPDYSNVAEINEKSLWAKKFELSGISQRINSLWKLGYRNIGNSYSSLGRSAFLRDVRIVEGTMSSALSKYFNSTLNLRLEKNNQSETKSATVRMILLSWQFTYSYKKLPTFFSTISPVNTTIWTKEPKDEKFKLKSITSTQGYFYKLRLRKNHFMFKQVLTSILRQDQLTKKINPTNLTFVNNLVYSQGIVKISSTYLISNTKNIKLHSVIESLMLSKNGYTFELGNRLTWSNNTQKNSFPFGCFSLEKLNWKITARAEKSSNSIYSAERPVKFWNLTIGIKLLI
jgi:hypothetical protein